MERESLDVGLHLQFGLVALGILATLLVSLALTDIPSPKRFAGFVAATFTAAGFTIFFLTSYYFKRQGFLSTIQRIRERQVGPVGEEGREMRPADIDQLPVTAAAHLSDSFAFADAAAIEVHPAPAAASATTPPSPVPETLVPQSGGQK